MMESGSVERRIIRWISSNGFVVKVGTSAPKIDSSVFFAPWVELTSPYVQIVSGTIPGWTSARNRLSRGVLFPSAPHQTRPSSSNAQKFSSEYRQ
jgi:hypothetical protein